LRRTLFYGTALALLSLAPRLPAQTAQLPPGSGTPGAASAVAGIGAKNAGSTTLIAVPEDFSRLKLAPGFLLHLEVYDTPEFTSDLRVDDQGNVAVPLAGSFHVADRTVSEARAQIEAALLERQILNHPQVTLNVVQYAPFVVAVLGEVAMPGRLQLQAPHSLLDIISQAGGVTSLAGNRIEVRHAGSDGATTDTYTYSRGSSGAAISGVMIHDGDTVVVPRAGIVYVLGAVNRPGGYIMQEDGRLDVAQALSLAQGTALQARVGAIRVIRKTSDGSYEEYPIDYRAVSEGRQKPLALEAQDIVYVPVSKIKAVFTNGASVVGQTASATIYAVR
jgi:polysaccharide export outer membrane protein